MIPNIEVLNTELITQEIPDNTHKILVDKNRVSGFCDGLDAIRQAIYLILSTERYKFPIYSWYYGVELVDLIGQPTSFVIPEIKRRITEALLRDERILSVDNFEFEVNKNKVFVAFVAKCEYGNIATESEVTI